MATGSDMTGRAGRIFSIGAGMPFLTILADAIVSGRLLDGLAFDPGRPLSLADATIFVPTRRAARVLRSEIVDRIGAGSAILPVIRPLGETDEDSDWLDDPPDDGEGLPPIKPMDRVLELAQLVLAWRNRLPEAIVSIHGGSPLVAPASPADAIWLARHLADIIDSLETEEIDWTALAAIGFETDQALWWQLTGEFLRIASDFWPARLAELNLSSPAAHRRARLDRETARIARGEGPARRGPVIVAGSTGSMPATARLIAAVAARDNGAVVLPGLDFEIDDAAFRRAGGLTVDGAIDPAPQSRSHPQYGLFQLLDRLGVDRTAVTRLDRADDDLDLRRRLHAMAMLPSDETNRWSAWRKGIPDDRLTTALDRAALVVAPNERAEALAIAAALKLAVTTEAGEKPRQAALITPDRTLARRVGNELRRFGIEAEDSAGMPLLSSKQGSLMHLLLEAVLLPGDSAVLAALLAHPLLALGLDRSRLGEALATLEMAALRGGTRPITPSTIVETYEAGIARLSNDRHPARWWTARSPEAIELARDLAKRLEAAIEPLATALMAGEKSLSDWASLSARVLEALAIDADGNLAALWGDEAGEALMRLISGLIDVQSGITAGPAQWVDVMTAMMAGESVAPRHLEHPRVFIWGGLEARLQSVDTVIIGSLNEGQWPATAKANPFLSRLMKTLVGLEPPERRIGQAAHDFVMAASHADLILTRSAREGTTPTVASRFLQRLGAVAGDRVMAGLTARGDALLAMISALDDAEATTAPGRPAPRPDAGLQPRRYSFSEVGRLRRDPYQIHARRILGLDPLEPFNADPGPAERGTLYHAIVERFLKAGIDATAPDAQDRLRAIARAAFDEAGLPVHVEAVWWPRFDGVARRFLAHEASRPKPIAALTEVPARLDLPKADLLVTGIADRIDLLADGSADIIDYKTGANPSVKEARSLLDPQLALEAAALLAGGFRDAGRRPARDLLYVRLRPGKGFSEDRVNHRPGEKARGSGETVTTDLLANRATEELERLVLALREGRHGFVSRLIPKKASDHSGDYDHLARVAEWSVAEDDEGGDDGD